MAYQTFLLAFYYVRLANFGTKETKMIHLVFWWFLLTFWCKTTKLDFIWYAWILFIEQFIAVLTDFSEICNFLESKSFDLLSSYIVNVNVLKEYSG